jgi:hypothetical protein
MLSSNYNNTNEKRRHAKSHHRTSKHDAVSLIVLVTSLISSPHFSSAFMATSDTTKVVRSNIPASTFKARSNSGTNDQHLLMSSTLLNYSSTKDQDPTRQRQHEKATSNLMRDLHQHSIPTGYMIHSLWVAAVEEEKDEDLNQNQLDHYLDSIDRRYRRLHDGEQSALSSHQYDSLKKLGLSKLASKRLLYTHPIAKALTDSASFLIFRSLLNSLSIKQVVISKTVNRQILLLTLIIKQRFYDLIRSMMKLSVSSTTSFVSNIPSFLGSVSSYQLVSSVPGLSVALLALCRSIKRC